MSVGEGNSSAESGRWGRRSRRRRSEAQKRQTVAETHEPGVSVPMVARRYSRARGEDQGGALDVYALLKTLRKHPPKIAGVFRLSLAAGYGLVMKR